MVKKLKKIAAVLMAVAICAMQPLGSVGLPANEPIVAEAASAAKLNRTKLTILKGKTYTLKLTGASGSVKWTSSKTSVARLAPSGKKCVVKARKVGTSTVTAKVGTKRYKCKVTVVQPVTKVTLNKTALSFTKSGASATLKTSVKPSSAYKKTVKWSTSDKNVATVTSKGVVKPVANGTCTITATAKDGSGKKATCKVTVNIPGAAEAPEGGGSSTAPATPTPTPTPTDPETQAPVNPATPTPTPAAVKVSSVSLNTASFTLTAKGSVKQLNATVSPSNAANKALSWASSNTAVATVDMNGKVTSVANGTCTITATAKDGSGKSSSCKVTVSIPDASGSGSGSSSGSGSTGPTPTAVKVTSVTVREIHDSFDAASSNLEITSVGGQLYLKTQVLPSNAGKKSITWASSNTSVATVDSSGTVTAVASGDAVITATVNDGSGVKGSITVRVNVPVKATSITLSTTSVSLTKVGETAKVTAAVLPSNASNKSVTWYSSNTSVATVSQDGTITAVADGTANVYAQAADGSVQSGNITVTVSLAPDYTIPGAINLAGTRYTNFYFKYIDEYTKKLGVHASTSGNQVNHIIVIDNSIDLNAISYEIVNKSGVVEFGSATDKEYVTTKKSFSFYGRLTGSATVTFKYNGEILYTCDINVTSDDPDYVSWENWKKKVLGEIWTDSMTIEEKLYAAATYIRDNFNYGAPGGDVNPWEAMSCDCAGASLMFCNIAKEELGLQVGYVAYGTGVIYEHWGEASSNSVTGHVYSAVYYDGAWHGYDCQPPVS